MKKILMFALLATFAMGAQAQDKKSANKPVFTVVKEIPITSMKNQSRSGTCWNYSTLSFFEAEILKKSGKTYDLCESFIARTTWTVPFRWFACTVTASSHRAAAHTTCSIASRTMVSVRKR